MNACFGNGGLVTGGVCVGKTATDNCEVVEKLPEMAGANTAALHTCRVDPLLGAGTQFKRPAAYGKPWDLCVSANYQNNPGIETTATYVATDPRATANVELITPQSEFREGRITQLNFAINRVFRAAAARLQPRFDLHNAMNSASILAINPRYGAAWQQVRMLLAPRMAKFAFQVDF